MERNPNKPRLWLHDERSAAEAFFQSAGESRVTAEPMNGFSDTPLADRTPSAQAGFLCADPAIREELLMTLEGREKKKPEER